MTYERAESACEERRMKKRFIRRIALAVATTVMMLMFTGCGFSVGNVQKNDDYKELFPDRAEDLGKSYKTSNIAYKFSLDGDYGEMMVHLDTSEGHRFELMPDSPPGFIIYDEDDEIAVYAFCVDKVEYSEYTAYLTKVKNVNDRDFFAEETEDGHIRYWSYMADCGLDCGLAMEVEKGDRDNFKLLAFRGEPIEGSSSDIYEYQGEALIYDEDDLNEEVAPEEEYVEEVAEEVTEEVTEEAEDAYTVEEGTPLLSISEEVEKSLDSLDTDYSQVKWGVRYSLFDEAPGIVVSVSLCKEYDDYELVLAFTNLYENEVSVAANAEALGEDGSVIGERFFYETNIGAGNTVIETINCGDTLPDGRIHWTELSYNEGNKKYVPWEADYNISGKASDGYATVSYEMYAANTGTSADTVGLVTILLLDDEGYITAVGTDYLDEGFGSAPVSGETNIYGDEVELKKTANLAMFANPVK